MNESELKRYDRNDASASTSPSVLGTRTISPVGSLIHTTSGQDSRRWLQGGSANAGTPASSNALIERYGTQWLLCPDRNYAYHAGESRLFIDREYRNSEVSQLLLGIELECQDNSYPTFEQYDSLADLIIMYAWRYQWRWPYRIYGHYAVALPRGRRSDPVEFDWGSLMGRLYVRSAALSIPGL